MYFLSKGETHKHEESTYGGEWQPHEVAAPPRGTKMDAACEGRCNWSAPVKCHTEDTGVCPCS